MLSGVLSADCSNQSYFNIVNQRDKGARRPSPTFVRGIFKLHVRNESANTALKTCLSSTTGAMNRSNPLDFRVNL